LSPIVAEFAQLQQSVSAVPRRLGRGYWLLVIAALALVVFGAYSYSLMITKGLVVTGLRRPGMWGNLITDFVFWVGIAHSGTLISAVLFLFRARFRTAVYRVAEMMTVFGVLTAGLFPIFHLGRPWLAYWLFPYPNQRGLWINFRSPLVWDVFAVSTYLIVSSVFLLVGIAPDAAALKGLSTGWRRRAFTLLSLGWRGTDAQWRHYTRAYLFFAVFATPLVVSVHSVVSWDFAVSIVPGWRSTLFPPYFVAGAILSGVAMVITLLIPIRKALRLQEIVTLHHLEMLAKLVLFVALIVTYSYATEILLSLRSPPSDPERSTLLYRVAGDYAPLFWIMIACNCVGPLLLAFRKVRTSIPALLTICLAVNVGMWLERFNIVVTSLAHDHLPFVWRVYKPTWVEWGMTFGSFGWFFLWLLLSLKLLPIVSIAEMKEHLAPAAHPGTAGPGGFSGGD
jgi:molybdopterin-containing oxidoreductase family membrane subunit